MAQLPVGESYAWTEEVDELIGTMSDAKLARVLEIGVRTIARRRMKLGKKPYRQPRKPKPMTCIVCGSPFEVYPGVSKPRTTCPPPAPCQQLLGDAQRSLKGPSFSLTKMTRNIPGFKFLDPLDD